jgi:hypothetical protein
MSAKVKNYTSVFLNHRIGDKVRFVNGSYSTGNPGLQKLIEADREFGKQIFIENEPKPTDPKIEP